MKITTLALVLAAVVGCSKDKKVEKPTEPAQTPVAAKPATNQQLEQLPANEQVSPTLNLGGDIVKLCNIKAAATTNPTFDYDKDELSPEDRTVLDQLATCLTTGALKVGTGRYRPAETDNPYIFKPFSGHDSFPSGHATMAFALATSLSNEIKNGWVSAALYTFATGTAWSRLNDERHWLSDVLAGATVGITAATIVDRHPPQLLAEPNGSMRLEWRIAF